MYCYTKEKGKIELDISSNWWSFESINIEHTLHNLNGPAVNWGGGIVEYYIDGKSYVKRRYKDLIRKYSMLPKPIRLTHKLWWVREL